MGSKLKGGQEGTKRERGESERERGKERERGESERERERAREEQEKKDVTPLQINQKA